MTRMTSARVAGSAFLLYIVLGLPGGTLIQKATGTDGNAPDSVTSHALGALFLSSGGLGVVGALFFAMGSAIFSWLLLRGRMIPTVLAWLGVAASVLWIIGLPLQLVGILRGPAIWLYIPMAAFEVPFALWLLIKGVSASTTISRQLAAVS